MARQSSTLPCIDEARPVPCPVCGRAAGQDCVTRSYGETAAFPHIPRLAAARRMRLAVAGDQADGA